LERASSPFSRPKPDRFVDDEPGENGADLAGIGKGAAHHVVGHRLQVRVGEDNARRLAAELHDRGDHPFGGLPKNGPARGEGTREHHMVHAGMGNQGPAGVPSPAANDVHAAFRHPGPLASVRRLPLSRHSAMATASETFDPTAVDEIFPEGADVRTGHGGTSEGMLSEWSAATRFPESS
jgi:hypothetical protein